MSKIQKIFITVGLPGSGKTTWSKKYIKKYPKTLLISCDDLRQCLHAGKYIFDPKLENLIEKTTNYIICESVTLGKDIIIDETNLTTTRRQSLIKIIKKSAKQKYQIIAVNIKCKDNLKRRLKESRGYSKKHWEKIIKNMKKNYNPITNNEGFNKIIEIEN